jgi:protein-tyrosine phosphatase
MVRICFVCLGNICRSPTAEAVMKQLVREADLTGALHIESAGTGDWHVGEPRDRRSQATAAARGVPLSGRAQHFTAEDFDRFDYVVAMDGSNLENLLKMARDAGERAKVSLLRGYEGGGQDGVDDGGDASDVPEACAVASGADVPDPYYGGARGFEDVFDICQAACTGFLAWLRREHQL